MFRDLKAVASILFFLFPRPARAASLTKNFTFSSGSVAYSSQVNSNFDQLFMEMNNKETRMTTLEGEAWSKNAGNLCYTAGNVGIGTTSPSNALDVTGGLTVYDVGSNVSAKSSYGITLGTSAKGTSPTNGQGVFTITSNDASNVFQALMALVSDPTAGNRRFSIQALEQGVAYRNLTLQENGGNVGIGTTSPGAALDITTATIANTSTTAQRWSWSSDTTNWGLRLNQRFVTPPSGIHYDWIVRNGSASDINVMTFMSTGKVGIGTTNPGYLLDVQGGGINTSGAYTNVSDARLKTNVKQLTNSLAKILRLRGVSFDWIDRPGFDRSRQIGFLAQEVQKEFPEAVKTGADGTLSLSYSMLVAPIAEALKELAGFVTQLRLDHDSAVLQLRNENQSLNAQLAAVEGELCRKDPSYSFCRQ